MESYMQKNQAVTFSCTTDKKTQMDHRPKCKSTRTMKFLEEYTGINLCDLGLGKTFLDMIL